MASLETQRRIFIAVLLGLFFLLLWILKPFAIPILLGIILVVLFHPVYDWFLRIFRGRRYLASFVTTLLVFLFLFVPLVLIGSLVTNQLLGVVEKQIVPFIERGDLMTLLQKVNVNLQHSIDKIEETFKIQINLKTMAASALRQSVQYISKNSPTVVLQTLSFVFNGFLTLFVIFFLFVEGKGLYHELSHISPLKRSHETTFSMEIKNMINAVIYGSFVTALIQAVLAGLGFYFLDFQGYLVWGALTFVFAFIPVLGAGTVWIVAAVFLFLTGETKSGIILTLYGALLISGIDNIIKPLLIGGKNKIHPLLLFLAILGSVMLVGPLGLLLGPVVLAVLMAALKIYKKEYFIQPVLK